MTGDNVTAIILCDYDGDGENELIVGSDDFDLRVFKGDTIVDETSESDAIICLHHIDSNRFAYALSNGTLGVYCGMERLWRIKVDLVIKSKEKRVINAQSKNTVICMHMYDIDGDDQQELTVGWGNGKLDFRHVDTGEVRSLQYISLTCFKHTQGNHQGIVRCVACRYRHSRLQTGWMRRAHRHRC